MGDVVASRVHYEIVTRNTQANRVRVVDLALADGVRGLRAAVVAGAVVAVFEVDHVRHSLEGIAQRFPGAFQVRYQSPQTFDNGSIISIYASAEDEVADKPRESTMRITVRRALCDLADRAKTLVREAAPPTDARNLCDAIDNARREVEHGR